MDQNGLKVVFLDKNIRFLAELEGAPFPHLQKISLADLGEAPPPPPRPIML